MVVIVRVVSVAMQQSFSVKPSPVMLLTRFIDALCKNSAAVPYSHTDFVKETVPGD